MTTLAKELLAFRTSLIGRIGRDTAAAFVRAEAEVLASGIGQLAPKVGDTAHDFTLPDATGRTLRLYALLDQGPVVLVFYRGGWCPFCTLSLRALQRVAPRLRSLRAQLIGISPELPIHARATAERNGLDFPLLHDADNGVADEWQLAQELSPAIQSIYARFGHVVPEINGTNNWRLPNPAGFVIAPDRRVALAQVDPRVYIRMEPSEAVAAVTALTTSQNSLAG